MIALKKLTMKTVCGAVKVTAGGPRRVRMRVLGIVTGLKRGMSTFGEWIALQGEFRATNAETGESFISHSCLLTELATTTIVNAYNKGEGRPLEFACDIIITPDTLADSSGNVGYTYSVEWHSAGDRVDPLAALEARLAGSMKALTAPSPSSPDLLTNVNVPANVPANPSQPSEEQKDSPEAGGEAAKGTDAHAAAETRAKGNPSKGR